MKNRLFKVLTSYYNVADFEKQPASDFLFSCASLLCFEILWLNEASWKFSPAMLVSLPSLHCFAISQLL